MELTDNDRRWLRVVAADPEGIIVGVRLTPSAYDKETKSTVSMSMKRFNAILDAGFIEQGKWLPMLGYPHHVTDAGRKEMETGVER